MKAKKLKIFLTEKQFDTIREALHEYALICGYGCEQMNGKLSKKSILYTMSNRCNKLLNYILKQQANGEV